MAIKKISDVLYIVVGGIIAAHIIMEKDEEKNKMVEGPQYHNLAPPGSRAILHDTSVQWHGDELMLP